MPTTTATTAWLYALARRLHFYLGLLIAPFIMIAAATGALYALAPRLKKLPTVMCSQPRPARPA